MENHKTVKHALFSPLAKEIASDLGLEMQLPNLEAFSLALREAARSDNRLFVVTSDSRGSGKLVPFADEFPEQIVEVGIAEQNLVGIAAGLASANHRVYAVSPACFLTARSLEQIKNDVAYSDNRVNLVGISAGVSYGALGSTHHSLHDLAATRAIHNLDIVVPADNFETTAAIKASLNYPRPIYLRFGKAAMYGLYSREAKFEIGKANLLRGGCDATIISTGEMTQQAVLASKLLESSGISAAVLSMHTVKPLDEGAILEAANKNFHYHHT